MIADLGIDSGCFDSSAQLIFVGVMVLQHNINGNSSVTRISGKCAAVVRQGWLNNIPYLPEYKSQ